MRSYIVTLGQISKDEIDDRPVMVFDREGYGVDLLYDKNQVKVIYVTWEKHIDTKKTDELEPWNARKQMVEWLSQFYDSKNEYVDLFYAITNCHGWIKSEKDRVVVPIEPPQQYSRHKAQIQFCRKLTQIAVVTPGGKILEIEVRKSPIE